MIAFIVSNLSPICIFNQHYQSTGSAESMYNVWYEVILVRDNCGMKLNGTNPKQGTLYLRLYNQCVIDEPEVKS